MGELLEDRLPPLPPPGQPSQELLDLHRKAIEHPDSLTDEDRRRILGRLPADEEDGACRDICGLSWAELVQKALTRPEELSDDEACLAASGVSHSLVRKKPGGADYDYFSWLQQPKEDQERRRKARNLATTNDDRTARDNAWRKAGPVKRRQADAMTRLSSCDRFNIAYLDNLDWMQETQQLPAWGFVLFRTSFGDDDAWRRFKELFVDAIETSLLFIRFSGRIRKTWSVQYIEDEALADASPTQLRDRFRVLCRGEDDAEAGSDDVDNDNNNALRIQPGLRRDVFLYADADAVAAVLENAPLPKRGHVWAADPSFPFRDDDDDDAAAAVSTKLSGTTTFEGVVPVATTALFTSFYVRLDPAAPSPADPHARNHGCVKQNWRLVWRKARSFYEPLVYPPPLQFNK